MLSFQDLNTFLASPAGQDPEIKAHFSSIGLARIWEQLLDLEDYAIVQPFIRMSEQADAQRMMQSQQEQVGIEGMTSSGLGVGNHDEVQDAGSMAPGAQQPPGPGAPEGTPSL